MERSDDRSRVRMVPPDIFAADQAAAQEPGGFVIQLLGDLLAHAAPGGRFGFDLCGFDHFIDRRKMLRQPGGAGAAFGGGVAGSRPFFQFSLQDGGIRAGGRGFFCPLVPSLQQQHQLSLIKLLAFGSKDPPHQQIDLFPQQFVFLTQGGHFFSQAGFEGRHHQAGRRWAL